MKKILITQSNYIPWKGYFDTIRLVDEVVLLDDVQFTKRDWRNRNLIKAPNGPFWLTIPVEVKGKFLQRINETTISDKSWNVKHWKTIQQFYSRAENYNQMKDFIGELYDKATMELLSDINYWFLLQLCHWMNISTPIKFSNDFELEDDRNEKLVSICLQANATDYYTGPAAKNYIDEKKFHSAGLKIHYLSYDGYTEYPQLFQPFSHQVSIIDLLLNTGRDFNKYLKHTHEFN